MCGSTFGRTVTTPIVLFMTTLFIDFRLYTYIIGHYNPSVRITTLFLTPLILCTLILYMRGGTYNLKSTPNDRFLSKFLLKKSAER